MTKVESIECVLKQNGESANLILFMIKFNNFIQRQRKAPNKNNLFKFVNYDEMIETYEHVVNGLKNNNWLI